MPPIPNGAKVDEFGDFQTPTSLAKHVCKLLSNRGVVPASVLEPTCGIGNFLLAAVDQFPMTTTVLGVEINTTYIEALKASLRTSPHAEKITLIQANFFQTDWPTVLAALPEPILVIGNPPWVTNSRLGV
ncbi:MAG: N-6 DNA methylase, partial [Pyrinomonadaceae bacterium]